MLIDSIYVVLWSVIIKVVLTAPFRNNLSSKLYRRSKIKAFIIGMKQSGGTFCRW
jgi:hypothetical protein